TLVISENPPINPNVSLNVTTDGSGYFESQDFTIPDNAAGSNYPVTASNSAGTTSQVTFNDSAAGSLCADVADHGAGVCPGATGATGVLGVGVTHYTQPAGSTATYKIIGAADAVTESSGFCSGGVRVQIKSTPFGNTVLCGSRSGDTITFSWTAQSGSGGAACDTTIVAYKDGDTGGRNAQDQFSNTNN